MSYTVNKMPDQIDESLLKKCLKAETATIGHKRHIGFVDRQVQNILNEKKTIAGTAITLAIPGQDSTLLHHIIQFLRPRDILSIDRLGDDKHACLGGGVAAAIVAFYIIRKRDHPTSDRENNASADISGGNND